MLWDLALTLDAQVAARARDGFAQLRLVRELHPLLQNADLTIKNHSLVT